MTIVEQQDFQAAMKASTALVTAELALDRVPEPRIKKLRGVIVGTRKALEAYAMALLRDQWPECCEGRRPGNDASAKELPEGGAD